jgi:hypothetical protein
MRVLGIGLALTLTACSSYAIRTTSATDVHLEVLPPPGLGLVCAVRPHIGAWLVPFVFRDNGNLVGGTRGPSYFCYLAEPGEHVIVAEGGDDSDRMFGTTTHDSAKITIVPGRRYFLHQTLGNVFGVSGLQWVDEQRGRELMADCQWADLEATPAEDHPPGRLPIARATTH